MNDRELPQENPDFNQAQDQADSAGMYSTRMDWTNMKNLETIMDGKPFCAITSSCVISPPLDEVTVLSLTETEQSSSCDVFSDISSVDSSDNGDDTEPSRRQQQRPRSIFSSYWSQKCRIGLQRQTVPFAIKDEQDGIASASNYEQALEEYEEEIKSESFTVFQRTMSLPQMARATRPKPISRKAWSGSVLETRAPSCLRPRGASNKPALSVRFSETVHVVEFTAPTATWAPKGWSSFFF